MSTKWLDTRQKVVAYARKLQAERLVYSTAGNISVRVPGEPGLLAVTPTSTQYDFLEPEDIAIIDLDGNVVDGRRAPTSETPMHTLICRRRPEVGAIVHTHGKAVMTMANLGWTLPPILTGLVEATGGPVYTSPYSQPETDQMADFTAEALEDRGATFMRFHGLIAIGADLEHAFHTASVVEGACEVFLTIKQLGVDVEELPQEQVDWIASYWRAQFPGAPEPLPAPEPKPYPGLVR
ncbi:class II aldolase/adducin family protein [Microbispora sp. H10885]|uniref:class II aldolase/adducin family protein n=1 Tax=Microbispora sp. H10885 TaxID=2729110 RepID=UPI0016039A30|nr:class II aldolase/adducin family protein [Microbispora sp. H10885]